MMRLTGAAIAAILSLGMMVTGEAWAAGAENIATSRQNTQTTSAPTIQVYTRETIVDVMVTDKSGKPVHGLTRSDFTIEQDGQPQSIRGFQEFSGVGTAAQAMPKLPPGVYTNYSSVPASGPVNIFLIDALNGDRTSVAYTQQNIHDYIEQKMPAGTQVAICLLSGGGLQILQGFTSNGSALLRAINANFLGHVTSMDGRERNYTTINALDQIAAYVAGIKGRKNLLWFVPGMPVYVMHDGGYAWGFSANGPAETSNQAMVHRLMDVYDRFTAEQIAISPVSTGGAGVLPTLPAEAVAEDTGGQAYGNNNDIKGMIDSVIRDQSQFYTLTYATPNAATEDSHFKSIRITVSKPGLNLTYRKGYNAEEPSEPIYKGGTELMTVAMNAAAPISTQVLFDVGVKQGAVSDPKTAKTVGYEFQYLVPQSGIALADRPDGGRDGALEFNIVAYDAKGKKVASQTQTMALPLSADEYQAFLAKPLRFSQTLDLPAEALIVRVGVLDTVSKKVGTMEIPLDAGSGKPQKLSRLPVPGSTCGAGCNVMPIPTLRR